MGTEPKLAVISPQHISESAIPGFTSAMWWYLLGGCITFFAVFYTMIYGLSHRPRKELPSETKYVTAEDPTLTHDLPTLNSEATVELSVVVPCYNESKRLPRMLEESIPFLETRFGRKWEILLVDDGSRDNTIDVALEWTKKNAKFSVGNVRACKLEKNRGKGGAVTHGIKHSAGSYILFADADGASKFSDVQLLLDSVENRPRAVAVGSRAHLVKTDAVVKRTFIRNLLMYGLHTLLFVFGIRSIHDTQCGFKLFTRQAAREIFPFVHTERWIFDVEILIIAMRKLIDIFEVAISWHEVEGSKVDLARDSVLMAIDLVVIRFAYLLGIYRDS